MSRRALGRTCVRGWIAFATLAVFAVAAAAVTPAATSATLNEPTTPILDNFDGRGLEDPLDQWGNWAPASIDGSGPTMENFGGNASHNEGSAVHGDSFRSTDSPPGDAEVYATIGVSPINDRFMYLYLNLQEVGTPGVDGYEREPGSGLPRSDVPQPTIG